MSRVSSVSSSRFVQDIASPSVAPEAPEAPAPASSPAQGKASGEWVTAKEDKSDSFSSQAQSEPQKHTTHPPSSSRTQIPPRSKSGKTGDSRGVSARSTSSDATQPPIPRWLQNSGLGQEAQTVLYKSLQQKPECAAGLQALIAHPQFASQDEKTKLMLLTSVFANKSNRAQELLTSQDFQNLSTAQKHQACHALLTSSHFQASRISDVFEKVELLKKEFQRLDPNTPIGRASLANTVSDVLKSHPEVFQLLGVKERLSVMRVMLGQLGADRNQDTQTQRSVLQAFRSLQTDNPDITQSVAKKTLEGMQNPTFWKNLVESSDLALAGQLTIGRIPGIPGYLANKAFSIGAGIALNDGVAQSAGGFMEAILSTSVGTWLSAATRMGNAAGWAVTVGLVAFDGFKGYVTDQVNQSNVQHAQQWLKQSGLLK